MKNLIVLSFALLFSVSCANMYSYYYLGKDGLAEYEKRVGNIEPMRKGERKRDFVERYRREKENIYKEVEHKYVHSSHFALYPDCEYCNAEAESRRIAEEQRRNEIRQLEEKKKTIINKIKNLEKIFFTEKYINEKLHTDFNFVGVLKTIDSTFTKYQKQRLNEVDALERKYIGRLNGEIFLVEKSKIDEKWREKEAVLVKNVDEVIKNLDAFKRQIDNEYIAFVKENVSSEELKLIEMKIPSCSNDLYKLVNTLNTQANLLKRIIKKWL